MPGDGSRLPPPTWPGAGDCPRRGGRGSRAGESSLPCPTAPPGPPLYYAPHKPSSPAPAPGPGRLRPKEGVMTRQYEVVYIFDSAIEEAAINERLARFHALIQVPEAEAPQVSHWGKRSLAYPIKKHETGYYVVAKFDAEPTALPEFERAIKLDDGVMRFLVVVNEGAQPVPVTAGKGDEEDDA